MHSWRKRAVVVLGTTAVGAIALMSGVASVGPFAGAQVPPTSVSLPDETRPEAPTSVSLPDETRPEAPTSVSLPDETRPEPPAVAPDATDQDDAAAADPIPAEAGFTG